MAAEQNVGALLGDLHTAWAQGGANRFVPLIDVSIFHGNVGDLFACP